MIWRYRDLRVHFKPKLDGYGTVLAKPFRKYMRRVSRAPYERCFEWCAGPGFIGLSLLRAKIARQLVLADRNPAVKRSIDKTRAANELAFSYYESDNLSAIPPGESFDLVVANPPSYCRLNPEHPSFAKRRLDPRPNDPDWRIHAEFYRTVKRYLRPGAELYISEVEPHRSEVFLPQESRTIPYDLRARAPLADFREMIEAGGLELIGTERYFKSGGVRWYMVRSRCPG